jgi:hypothetical protein
MKWTSLDIYSRAAPGVRTQTLFGSFVTVVASVIMLLLFFSEVVRWRTVEVRHRASIDPSNATSDLVDVEINITFHYVPCDEVRINVDDAKGSAQRNVVETVRRTPWRSEVGGEAPGAGRSAGGRSSHAPPAAPAEGCTLEGTLRLPKVAGDFHVLAGPEAAEKGVGSALAQALFGLGAGAGDRVDGLRDAKHTIHHLAFGPAFPGRRNPLDGRTVEVPKGSQARYALKVVPTRFVDVSGRTTASNQLSATLRRRDRSVEDRVFPRPGVFFQFTFTPLMIDIEERRRSFLQFVTGACAILGGVFTVSGMVDSAMHRSQMALKNK